jgi:transposase
MGASERDEWLRLLWRTELSKVDARLLVFVDECGTNTSLAPLYAYAPKGSRAHGKVPRNRGKNTTLIASMTISGMGEAMAFEGATDASTFEAYVERFLAPTLKEKQIVVMDNLGAHRGEKVRKLIEARGAQLWFLPSYSPDLNPIEEAFSKIKALLKKKAARTKGALLEAIAEALQAVTPKDAEGWFAHCGYDPEAQYYEHRCIE